MKFDEFKNKVVLVTGGSRGIGQKIAEEFAANGAKVIVISSTTNSATAAEEYFKSAGYKIKAIAANIADLAAAEAAVAEVISSHARIDYLINNAGITKDNLILRMKEEEWHAVINTNLNGLFYITRQVVKQMFKQRHGRIVSISSVVGFSGNYGQVNYSTTKSALIGFTKSLAKECAKRNINCNLVAPGFIESDMTKNLATATKDAIIKNIPLAKMGKPKDIANGVLFLCSDAAEYITGTTLHINGGML